MTKRIIEKSPYLIWDPNSEFIYRAFTDKDDYQREIAALLDCTDSRIQEIISYNDLNKIIKIRYYSHMSPFTLLTERELDFFIYSLIPIMNIIQHCHQCGWVHGDIKPSNFLYNKKYNEFKLIDFSAALPIGFSRTKLNYWQYTRTYASLDQQRGTALVQARDDWYSLGRWVSQLDLTKCNQSDSEKIDKIKNRLAKLS